jgi:hypothetical protein
MPYPPSTIAWLVFCVFCIPQVPFRLNWANWRICSVCIWKTTNLPVLSCLFSPLLVFCFTNMKEEICLAYALSSQSDRVTCLYVLPEFCVRLIVSLVRLYFVVLLFCFPVICLQVQQKQSKRCKQNFRDAVLMFDYETYAMWRYRR